MLEGLDDVELEAYLDDNPQIVPLFEIDVMEPPTEYAPYASGGKYEPDLESIIELSRAHEAFERETELSRRVTASVLEEVNIGWQNQGYSQLLRA